MEEVHGAKVWKLSSDKVELHVTEVAGMSTATFDLGGRKVAPYSLSPWQPDEIPAEMPPLLKYLRGDFFCLPFGPQDDGPPHGDTANASWEKDADGSGSLSIKQKASDTGASVVKNYELRDGQTAIYYSYTISELDGDWSYGTHPVIDASGLPEGSGRVSVSPFRWASVYEGLFSHPDNQERQRLHASAKFDDLSSVPRMDGGGADLTRWPARPGYDDLVMMVSEEATEDQPFAWSAIVMDGYVWFAIKNPEDFPSTLFWMSNGGRDAEPWNGRHKGRIGIEEVCSHFSDNVKISRESHLAAEENIPTTRSFKADETVTLKMIHAVAAVPEHFGKVLTIQPDGDERISITDENGIAIEVSVDWSHVL